MPSDFLSNLSSRALQQSEIDAPGSELKPRLASRFESNVPAGLAVDQTPDEESLIEVEGNADTGFRNSATASDQPPIGRNPVSHERSVSGIFAAQAHRREEPKHFLENQASPAVRDLLKPMPATEHFDSFPKPFAPAHTQQTDLSSLDQKDVTTSPRTELQQIIERHTTLVETSSTDPRQVLLASVPVLPSSQTKVVPERIEVTRTERQPQLSPKASQIMPSVELPAFKSQSRAPETQEQPPTIHVTIGRIEVKAAPPAAAPKHRAAASPTMSLEEYLRRRPGGER